MVERIRKLIESRKLTPTQFADSIGVARPIISHILSGRNKPSLDVVQRILAAMPELSMSWLLNGAGPMEPVPQQLATVVVPRHEPSAPAPPIAAQSGEIFPSPQVSTPTAPQAVLAAAAPIISQTRPLQSAKISVFKRFSARNADELNPIKTSQSAPGPSELALEPVAAEESNPPLPQPAAVLPAKLGVAMPSQPSEEMAVSALEVSPSTIRPAQPSSLSDDYSAAKPAAAAPSENQHLASHLLASSGKAIRRIVIFYHDGTFADYQPE